MAVQGGFKNSFYVADSAETHNIKINETTLELLIGGTAQVEGTGPATSPFWVRNNKNAREYGLDTRSIGVCFTTTAPDGLKVGPTYNVTVLTAAQFNGLAIGDDVSYQGETAEVVSKRSERIFPES